MSSAQNIQSSKTALESRPREGFIRNPKVRLQDQFPEVCRFKHLARRTEASSWGWVRRFLLFHKQGAQRTHEIGVASIHSILLI